MPLRLRFVCLLVCIGCLLSSPPAGAQEPAQGLSATEQSILDKGLDAYAAGEFRSALGSFNSILAAHKDHPVALHGAGLCCWRLDAPTRARDYLEKAAAAAPEDARIAFNAALLQLKEPQPMRAARTAMTFLKGQRSTPDEAVLNLLGSALQAADEQARKNRFFSEATAFYEATNRTLESQHPGRRRWGGEWVTEEEFEKRTSDLAAKDRQIAELNKQIEEIEGNLSKARQALSRLAQQRRNTAAAEARVEALTRDLRQRTNQLNDLRAARPTPRFPETYDLLPLTEPPAATEVAANDDGATVGDPFNPTPGNPTTQVPPAAKPASPPAAPRKRVRVNRFASGFPVAPRLFVTAASVMAGAQDIEIQTVDGSSIPATLVRSDAKLGLALIRVEATKFLPFPLADAFEGGDIRCIGMAGVHAFQPTAQVVAGNAPKPGVDGKWSVRITERMSLPGAALVDSDGRVVGMLLSASGTDPRSIPAVTLEQLRAFVGDDADPKAAPHARPVDAVFQVMITAEE